MFVIARTAGALKRAFRASMYRPPAVAGHLTASPPATRRKGTLPSTARLSGGGTRGGASLRAELRAIRRAALGPGGFAGPSRRSRMVRTAAGGGGGSGGLVCAPQEIQPPGPEA